MAQKKLMLLGGLRYLLPVIEVAHELGYYVITCDYLPDNFAHRYSDEYCNVSIIDKEAVLKVAREKQIDGIMSFAVDPGVVTAAYVAEQMGLPNVGPYKSVEILQNKHLFRKFLADNGFNVPKARGYSRYEDILKDVGYFTWPVIVKPVDSAGSKGVTRVDQVSELEKAFAHALECSISKNIIVEEFIEKRGCQSSSECFSIDGRLEFVSFDAQRFDENAFNIYTPAAHSWPSTLTEEEERYLAGELQRLLTLLGMRTSIYNVETRVNPAGVPYIMEVSPRGGGNRLAEMVRFATGVDLIRASVLAAVGEDPVGVEQKGYNGHWAEVILHADKDGIFKGVVLDEDVRNNNLVELDLYKEIGEPVSAFKAANDSLGTLIVRFDSAEELDRRLSDIHSWVEIVIG